MEVKSNIYNLNDDLNFKKLKEKYNNLEQQNIKINNKYNKANN